MNDRYASALDEHLAAVMPPELILTPPATPAQQPTGSTLAVPRKPNTPKPYSRSHSPIGIPGHKSDSNPNSQPGSGTHTPAYATSPHLPNKVHPVFPSILPEFDNMLGDDSADGGHINLDAELDLNSLVLDERTMVSSCFKFLDVYTEEEVEHLLEDAGLVKDLNSMGFNNVVFQMDLSDLFVHRLTISDETLLANDPSRLSLKDEQGPSAGKKPGPFTINEHNFLVDMFARRKRLPRDDISGVKDLSEFISRGNSTNSQDEPKLPQLKFSMPDHALAQRVLDFLTTHYPPPVPTHHASLLSSLLHLSHSPSQSSHNHSPPNPPQPLPSVPSTAPPCKVTILEWICMQNPTTTTYNATRPRLPGQHHPGLSHMVAFQTALVKLLSVSPKDLALSRHTSFTLLDQEAMHLNKRPGSHSSDNDTIDALVAVPEHFHLALFYTSAHWKFISPAFQGYFAALTKSVGPLLHRHGISAVSWAFANGHVMDTVTGQVHVWRPQELAFVVSPRMKGFFENSIYTSLAKECEASWGTQRWKVDWDNAKEIWKYSVSPTTSPVGSPAASPKLKQSELSTVEQVDQSKVL